MCRVDFFAFRCAGQPLSAWSSQFEESKKLRGRDNAGWHVSIASARLTA
jgi:hypothetical protein